MKKILKNSKRKYSFILALVATVLFLIQAFPTISKAQSATEKEESSKKPSPTTAHEEVIEKLKQIENLKEKIATKVAELREKEKKAFFGKVKSISDERIVLSTEKGEKSISYSDDTLFYETGDKSKKEIEYKDIEKGSLISAFGYMDEDEKSLIAKFIILQKPISHIIGKVADIDKKNYTITIKEKKGNIIVDIEKYTTTYLYDKKKAKSTKIGYSKLELGQIAHVIGLPHKTEDNRVHAQNMYVFSFADKKEEEKKDAPTATSEESKKEASPTATPEEEEKE